MIRVLRVLEYIYEDWETAEEDMANWQIAPFGSKYFGGNSIHEAKKKIYSGCLPAMTEILREREENG